MNDQRLFDHIRLAVKQNQKAPKNSEPSTFAQRYCKKQLLKKKLNPFNPHEKMAHLMKNFQNLDTFVDLPELIANIRRCKLQEMLKKQQDGKKSNINSEAVQSDMRCAIDSALRKKIKKQLGEKIKEKYISDNNLLGQVLNQLEKEATFRSDGLKNNSSSNLNLLYEKIEAEGEDFTWKGNFDFREMLHKVNRSEEKSLNLDKNNSSNEEVMNGEFGSKNRKQFTKILHKITTYLQIILEMEHKQKWGQNKKSKDRASSCLKDSNLRESNFSSGLSQKKPKLGLHLKKKSENLTEIKKETTPKNMFNTFQIEEKDKENFSNTNLKYQGIQQSKVAIVSQQQKDRDEICQRSLSKTFSSFSNNKIDRPSFCQDTNCFNMRKEALSKHLLLRKSKQSFAPKPAARVTQDLSQLAKKEKVRENFTFRNRNIKQNIINRIGTFIKDIDDEEHSNKKQNRVYNSEISKLENILSLSFGKFQQESLAGDTDIKDLTKYATHSKHSSHFQTNVNATINEKYLKEIVANTRPPNIFSNEEEYSQKGNFGSTEA